MTDGLFQEFVKLWASWTEATRLYRAFSLRRHDVGINAPAIKRKRQLFIATEVRPNRPPIA